MANFETQYAWYAGKINEALPGFLPPSDTPYGSAVKAMAYSLLDGGKRVRGVLLLAVYAVVSGRDDAVEALPYAAALEMIHAYSLIHDDLPCMDNDDLRRGKPSCHIAFGEDIALLAGDGLLTLAFQTCVSREAAGAFGAEKALDALRALTSAAGTEGMIGGQVIDMESEAETMSVERMRKMDKMKTGALIAAAAEIGCILGGAGEDVKSRMISFALDLGLAFQIRDDILDLTGDASLLGKPTGSDSKNGKPTYTALYGVEKAAQAAGELSERAKASLRETGLDCGFLSDLTDSLLSRRS